MPPVISRSEYLTGKRLGVYEIKKLLGHGATASVFEAFNVDLGRRVALKILHEHLASEPRVSGRFRREGKIAASLRHPNALDVHDVGEADGLIYLVMELLDGRDLRAHLEDGGHLDLTSALSLVLPVASALGHAHALGAIHRDVKPANIVLARFRRDELRPKLVDFGLSKLVDDEVPLTSSDLVVGTADYMAPEATLGTLHVSPRSDQYSLAAVLYECLTSRPPVVERDFVRLIEAIRVGAIEAPGRLVDGIPPAFDAVILRALARNPEHRYPTVRAFGRALLPFADASTVRTYERDFAEASVPPPRRSSRASAAPRSTRRPSPARPELRPLPCPAGSSPFRIKGLPYRGLLHMVQRALPGGLDGLCEAVEDASLRDFIRQPFLATARYDVLPLVPLLATIVKRLDMPFEALVRAGTIAQTRYDARTVYKRLYDGATRHDAAARIARFEARYNDFATFDAWFDGPDLLVLQNAGVPEYLAPWYLVMHPTYTREATSLIGAPATATELPLAPAGRRHGFDVVTSRCEVRWA